MANVALPCRLRPQQPGRLTSFVSKAAAPDPRPPASAALLSAGACTAAPPFCHRRCPSFLRPAYCDPCARSLYTRLHITTLRSAWLDSVDSPLCHVAPVLFFLSITSAPALCSAARAALPLRSCQPLPHAVCTYLALLLLFEPPLPLCSSISFICCCLCWSASALHPPHRPRAHSTDWHAFHPQF